MASELGGEGLPHPVQARGESGDLFALSRDLTLLAGNGLGLRLDPFMLLCEIH